jgi:hydroxymethylpyrimidine/phosphomethylpyrimidine kinase
MKNVLSIAGSDSGGGAGIQADLKTMCALGVYGMTAITAVTAQNTQAVRGVQEIGEQMVEDQISAVFEDMRVDAVKVGMVSSAAIIGAVERCLKRYGAENVVLDPVMVSKSGCHLLKSDAIGRMREFVACARVVTPNIPEAELLCGFPVRTGADMRAAAEALVGMGAKSALVKGGHRMDAADAGGGRRTGSNRGGYSSDLLLAGGEFLWLESPRIDTKNTHGTGCTLSSAIACRLALGDSVVDAVRAAKAYITQAIADATDIGMGASPVGHMAALYRRAGMA